MALELRDYAGGSVDTTITATINATDLSISIASSTGWPSGGANGPFHVIIDYDGAVAGREKVEVASRTGTTLTVANTGKRGVDGTTAQSHTSGATIRHCYTAQDADEANRAVAGTIGLVTTKGDLIAATGANTFGRRAVGSNGLPLVADSGQATGLNFSALTSAALGTDSVGATQIAANAVGASELADNAVDTNAIANLAVTGAKVANDTITSTQLATNAVDTAAITDLAVTAGKIANGAVANGAALLGSNQQLVYIQSTNPGAVGADRIWMNRASGKRALLCRNAGNTAWEVLEAYDWVPYTPTYPGITVGNAQHFARYIRKGGVVIINGFFYIGTTTSFAGLTNLTVTLPTNAQAKDLDSFVGFPGTNPNAEFFGHSGARSTNTGAFFAGIGVVPQAGGAKAVDRMNFITTAGSAGAWDQTNPASWAAGNRFSYFIEYEPATLEDTNWV